MLYYFSVVYIAQYLFYMKFSVFYRLSAILQLREFKTFCIKLPGFILIIRVFHSCQGQAP